MDDTFLPAVWGQCIDDFVNELEDLNSYIAHFWTVLEKKRSSLDGKKIAFEPSFVCHSICQNLYDSARSST